MFSVSLSKGSGEKERVAAGLLKTHGTASPRLRGRALADVLPPARVC